MGVSITVRVDGEAAGERLESIELAAGDLTPAMKLIAAYGVSSTVLRFRTQTGPGGVPWPPSRRDGQTLRDSGRLVSSIAPDSGDRWASWGTNVKYAAVHQFGGTIRPVTRRFLAVPIHPAGEGKWPSEWPEGELFLVTRGEGEGSGPATLCRRRGEDQVEAIYLLLRSVTMPQRPFLGVDDDDLVELREILVDHVIGDAA